MDIKNKLQKHLRVIVCGSVDDGKSTLIGRLLYDTKKIHNDQLKTLRAESKKTSTKDKLDFSLLVDSLSAEREQGITIDVAYRYFSTKKKKIIIADTPGHEQYTRNMVTGASNCDLSIIIVNIKNGVTNQTKRHLYVCKLLQIKNIILIVNKMDLIDFNQTKFNEVVKKILNFTKDFDFNIINIIPASALYGDNLVINNDGNFNSVLADSDLLIQCGCTTAFQAAMYDIPIISYSVRHKLKSHGVVANNLGYKISSKEDAISYCEKKGYTYNILETKKRKKNIRKNGYGDNFLPSRKFSWTH